MSKLDPLKAIIIAALILAATIVFGFRYDYTFGGHLADITLPFLLAFTPACLYLIARLSPAAASVMKARSGIVVAVSIVGAFLTVFFTRVLVIDPCWQTGNWHTVTNSLGTYSTNYKDTGAWCQWIREADCCGG